MILLGILFFAIGGISGYQVVDSFYSYPINNELNNEVYYLEAEILKKEEEELAIKKEAEEEKINPDEVPDPVIDSAWAAYLCSAFGGFLVSKMWSDGTKRKRSYLNMFFYKPLFDLINNFISRIINNNHYNDNMYLTTILSTCFTAFVFEMFFKYFLAFFSSLFFKVHSFRWNVNESINLIFYFKNGWRGFEIFFFNVVFFSLALALTMFYDRNEQQQPSQQVIAINEN